MWKLALLVLNDPHRLDEILQAWEAVGVKGATILESRGLARQLGYLRDDIPLFPSMRDLMQGERMHNLTIFAILDESVEPERLLSATESVLGDLSQPNTGIFFATPLTFVKGLRSSRDEQG